MIVWLVVSIVLYEVRYVDSSLLRFQKRRKRDSLSTIKVLAKLVGSALSPSLRDLSILYSYY